MQQATRIADKTAFFLLGELVEFGNTDDIFTSPKDERTERYIRRIAELQEKSRWHTSEAKKLEEEVTKHAVRIAEVMQAHEHGLLETTSEKLLIDFVTKSTTRVDSALLKKNYETVYNDVLKKTESRKLKVSIQPI